MNDHPRCTVWDRPRTEHWCGCVAHHRFKDPLGEFQEGYTDQSNCKVGHGQEINPCPLCGRGIQYGACRWTNCPGNYGVEDTSWL